MKIFTDDNINTWIDTEVNVLFIGKHGVGKTTKVVKAWKDRGFKTLYYSASSMDPWTDFIGIPKERIDKESGDPYLDFVRPLLLQRDKVHAIFFDEFNRAPKKVRNAVMELIQFKSINGFEFKNLKFIWAAINPENDEANQYDVEALDPAQKDRFQVWCDVPYRPDADYFRKQFGRDTADAAIDWWDKLNTKEKDLVSPRRLDYAISFFNKGGDIRHIISNGISVAPLIQQLKNGPIAKQLEALFTADDQIAAKKFIQIDNNYNSAIHKIVENKKYMDFFIPLMMEERITAVMNEHQNVQDHIFNNFNQYKEIVKGVAASKAGNLAAKASEVMLRNINVDDIFDLEPWVGKKTNDSQLMNRLPTMKTIAMDTTGTRSSIYNSFLELLPSTLTAASSEESLVLLSNLTLRSQRDTIVTQMPNLIWMLGHTIRSCENFKIDWKNKVDFKALINKTNDVKASMKNQRTTP